MTTLKDPSEFSLREWMNGEDPPPVQRSPEIRQYTYGIRITKKGVQAFWGKGVINEPNIIEGYQVEATNGELAKWKAEALLVEWHQRSPASQQTIIAHREGVAHKAHREAKKVAKKIRTAVPPEGPPVLALGPGAFCVHSDSGGHHNCLIVDVTEDLGEPLFHALMLTTNPRWNPGSRLATPIEVAQLLPTAQRQSWLAPVSRPTCEFFLATRMVDPEVLKGCQREFGPHFERRH
jgi:hypothetical protein